jgi:hypothetical protein
VGFWRDYHLGGWEFFVREGAGELVLSVPDRGGQMDMVPKVAEQLAWAERHVPVELPAARQVWSVTWVLPPDALPEVDAFFRWHGATPWPDPAPIAADAPEGR